MSSINYPTVAPAGIVYSGSIAPFTPVYIPPPQPIVTYMVPISYSESVVSSQERSIQHYVPSVPPGVVKTEARKVIITSLPHSTTESDLRDLLVRLLTKSHACSDPFQAVHEMEIARHSDQKSRGHAFAVFETHQVAKSMISALDGLKFQNRHLSARFAKEGAKPSMYASLSSGQAYISPSTVDQRHALPSASPANSRRSETKSSCAQKVPSGVRSSSTVPTSSSRYAEKKSTLSVEEGGSEKKHRSRHAETGNKKPGSLSPPLVVSSTGREHRG